MTCGSNGSTPAIEGFGTNVSNTQKLYLISQTVYKRLEHLAILSYISKIFLMSLKLGTFLEAFENAG